MDMPKSKDQSQSRLRRLLRSTSGTDNGSTEEHQPQYSERNAELEHNRGDEGVSELHAIHQLGDASRTAELNPHWTNVLSNNDSTTAVPTSVGEKSAAPSPSASVQLTSSTSMHHQDSSQEMKPLDQNIPLHNLQRECRPDECTHAMPSAMDVPPSAHCTRQSTDQRSYRPGLSVPAPLLQSLPRSTSITQQQAYLLKACRALMMYGAPTHRLEEYMHNTAEILGLHLQSFYMPGCMIISFNDTIWRSTEVHIVRCTQALNLSKLYDVHEVYKGIIHHKLGVQEATAHLDRIMTRSDKFSRWLCVLMYGLASACIGPVSYGARPIDLPIIFLLGCVLGFMQLILAHNSELYANIFEISTTILIAFLSRAFGSIDLGPSKDFCFSSISQACLVMILPGFTITNSALELQSKNIVSGSVRMVYGIIYILFLAFGIGIGITIYGAIDHNATSATTCATTWPFWWQVIFVIPFTLCYIIINQGKWTKAPAMLILSLAGWLVNHFSAQYFDTNTQIAQTLGALTVGILANLYSRLGHGLAVALLYPAVFIQVPGSLAASGSLISGLASANQLTKHVNGGLGPGWTTTGNGTVAAGGVQENTAVLNAGYAMIEIAIGITVGLSVSALVVYPFRNRTGKSGLFSF